MKRRQENKEYYHRSHDSPVAAEEWEKARRRGSVQTDGFPPAGPGTPELSAYSVPTILCSSLPKTTG